MSNNGAALLGGLLIGGLVVGAAMSAENAAERQNRRNMRAYNRQQRRIVKGSTFCICGAKMVEGRIQQGVCKCNNLNCQRVLTGQICYYCPMGANVQQHRKGFFYCTQCAAQLRRQGNQVVNISNPPPMQVKTVPVVQQPKPVQKRGAYVVKQGYMSKKGNWFNTAYKKRWFKLWNNKKMAYLTHPGASYTKGYADFTKIKKMEKKGKHGMEITTPERVWSFLCQSEQDRNDWFITIQSVCMGIKPQVMVPVQPQPQPQVKYVPAPQPQPQYAQPQQALPNNGNAPQVQYAQPYIPQPQAQPIAQPQPQPQPMYRGSVIQQPSAPQPQPSQLTRPQSQSLQPGMVGYNGGDMYGVNNQMNNMNINNNNNNNNNSNQQWEDKAPPPAYAMVDASAPSAPPEDDVVPSAPPAEDDNVNEGAFTGQ